MKSPLRKQMSSAKKPTESKWAQQRSQQTPWIYLLNSLHILAQAITSKFHSVSRPLQGCGLHHWIELCHIPPPGSNRGGTPCQSCTLPGCLGGAAGVIVTGKAWNSYWSWTDFSLHKLGHGPTHLLHWNCTPKCDFPRPCTWHKRYDAASCFTWAAPRPARDRSGQLQAERRLPGLKFERLGTPMPGT